MRERLILGGILALTAVSGALHFADATPVAVFLVAAAALGADKARDASSPTLARMYEAMGFVRL